MIVTGDLTKQRFFTMLHHTLLTGGEIDGALVPVTPLALKLVLDGTDLNSLKHLLGVFFQYQAAYEKELFPADWSNIVWARYLVGVICLDFLAERNFKKPKPERYKILDTLI